MCCSHVGTDLGFGRESLADAIRQSEQGGEEGGPAFDWDIAVVLGDHSGGQTTPTDEEGREIVRQFGVSDRHPREHFYTVVGNHDAPIEVDAPLQWWARKWIDPTGEDPEHSEVNADRMPYAVDGTWERYTFAVGNIRFLMMSDRNDFPPPVGRRGASHGGYPSGAVTSETFDWWRRYLEANEDSVLVSTHHHMLKETTVASGPWEGHVPDGQGSWTSGYHGYFADGGPKVRLTSTSWTTSRMPRPSKATWRKIRARWTCGWEATRTPTRTIAGAAARTSSESGTAISSTWRR